MEFHDSTQPAMTMRANLKQSFGFTDDTLDEFCRLLRISNGYIAGGACLAAFLQKPLLKGQDLDVWLPTPAYAVTSGKDTVESLEYSFVQANWAWGTRTPFHYKQILEEMFKQFFQRQGYKAVPYWSATKGNEYRELKYVLPRNRFTQTVRSITNYVREGSEHKIQLITTYEIPPPQNLGTFDLNVCQFWCNYTLNVQHECSDGCLFEIKKGYMRANPKGMPLSVERQKKYEVRGFILLKENDVVGEVVEESVSERTSWFP
jgi:hypothetical protein